jgi:cell division protein FtsB
MTGRAAVLVLVVAVLTVSYASSLKAYLQQRQHMTDLKQQIAQSESDITVLEREKERWRDPAYVQSQARARFGYLMPGETSYVVLGADGKPLETQTSLLPKKDVIVKQPTAWWDTAWDSVLLAGNPPAPDAKPQPLAKIGPPKP